VPRRLDESRIADRLAGAGVLGDERGTFYDGILRLLPAHSMTVDAGGTRTDRYYSLDPVRELHLASDDEYAAQLQELFVEAVRCRMRSAFPVAATLSGGLDSSAVACVARDLLAREGAGPLLTVSAIFDQVPECDERPYINAVLTQGGFAPHYLDGDQIGPFTDLAQVLKHEDEPHHSQNLYLAWAWLAAAKEQGAPSCSTVSGETTSFPTVTYVLMKSPVTDAGETSPSS